MKVKNILKKIGSVLAVLLVIIELVMIAVIVVTKFGGDTPTLFGYNMYVIVSPSMEPDIEVGDVIISKKYEGGELEVGDVVTYLAKKGDIKGKVITHQIIEISPEGIITKGTANSEPDPMIQSTDIYSVMVYKTFLIDKIYGIVTTTAGFILLVVLPMIVMIVSEIINLVHDVKNEEGAKQDEQDKI